MKKPVTHRIPVTIVGLALTLAFGSTSAYAHCDTLGGPVVAAARRALESGDITPVLKWVKPANEGEVQSAFSRALAVRVNGPEARELADTYFFETVVRVHRTGEGAPYTGLKAAGDVEPVVAMSDEALASGSIEKLATAIGQHAADGVRQRFARALEAKKHAEESVAAGREFVEAYVEFTHYVERLDRDAATNVTGGKSQQATEHKH